MEKLTIPVQIDSIKQLEEFERTRCIYFRIELSEGLKDFPFRFAYNDMTLITPLLNWGVLVGPIKSNSNNGLFISSELINQTFLRIDEDENILLDLGHIWLPNELINIHNHKTEIRQGDVYRLSVPLFNQCYRFIAEMITEDDWVESCKRYSSAIWFSPQETLAFRDWRREQIKRSKERYHFPEYAGRRLPKKRTTE